MRPAGSIFGSGVTLGAGSALINNASGTVQGANSQGIGAGAGVYLRFGDLTLTNHGTIRGASDLAGVVAGNAAISEDGSTWNIAIINRGVIRAGAGQSNAIVFGQTAASASLLEVQAGSTIEGNVIGAELGTSDVLRLGGAANASFDVSAIGAEAQYRNFDIFEKTGAGTWALTGTGSIATPWTIQQGTLQLGDGGTSGSILGDVTNNSILAFNRSDTLNYDGMITGTGSVHQLGTGTTILTGNHTYTGGYSLQNFARRPTV